MFNKKFSIICAVGVISLALFTGCTGEKKAPEGIDVNEEAINVEEEAVSEEANPVEGAVLSGFSAKDTHGRAVDDNIFKDHKLTVVNLWGTFCGPCIEEMPDLQKISEAYSDKDVQVIGIVTDGENNDETTKMLEELKVTYLNIIPDKVLNDTLVNKFDYVPATVFVDSEGKILKAFIPGSASEEKFSTIIDELIK